MVAVAETEFLAHREQRAERACVAGRGCDTRSGRANRRSSARWVSLLAAAVACLAAPGSWADDSDPASAPIAHERPEIQLNRWQEDWSVLANPELRTEPLAALFLGGMAVMACLGLSLYCRGCSLADRMMRCATLFLNWLGGLCFRFALGYASLIAAAVG